MAVALAFKARDCQVFGNVGVIPCKYGYQDRVLKLPSLLCRKFLVLQYPTGYATQHTLKQRLTYRSLSASFSLFRGLIR